MPAALALALAPARPHRRPGPTPDPTAIGAVLGAAGCPGREVLMPTARSWCRRRLVLTRGAVAALAGRVVPLLVDHADGRGPVRTALYGGGVVLSADGGRLLARTRAPLCRQLRAVALSLARWPAGWVPDVDLEPLASGPVDDHERVTLARVHSVTLVRGGRPFFATARCWAS